MKLHPIDPEEDLKNKMFSSEDCRQRLQASREYYKHIGYNPPWIGYFIIRNNEVVGNCAFTGCPKNGGVEIAYWTISKYENQGVATFGCKELVSISQKEDPSIIITAKTLPQKNASTTILERNGFKLSGIVQDDEIGDAWEWIYNPISASGNKHI